MSILFAGKSVALKGDLNTISKLYKKCYDLCAEASEYAFNEFQSQSFYKIFTRLKSTLSVRRKNNRDGQKIKD